MRDGGGEIFVHHRNIQRYRTAQPEGRRARALRTSHSTTKACRQSRFRSCESHEPQPQSVAGRARPRRHDRRQACRTRSRPSRRRARPEFGDYQANGVMQAAKRMRRNPRELAADVVAKLDLRRHRRARRHRAGPGFINIRLTRCLAGGRREPGAAAAGEGGHAEDDGRGLLGAKPRKGNARRTPAQHDHRRCRGARVDRDRPTGDPPESRRRLGHAVRHAARVPRGNRQRVRRCSPISNSFYQAAKQRFDADPCVRRTARAQVVALQSGDANERTVAQVHRRLDESLRSGVRPIGRLADARGRARRERLQRRPRRHRSRARRCRFADDFRRRQVRIPRRVQGQGRHAAAGDRAEIRRRLSVFDDGSRGRALSLENVARGPRAVLRRRAAGAALPPGVRGRAARRLRRAEHDARASSVRRDARKGRPAVPFTRRRTREAGRSARRSAAARVRSGLQQEMPPFQTPSDATSRAPSESAR